MKTIFHKKSLKRLKRNLELIEWISKNNVKVKIVRNIMEDITKLKNVVKIGLISPAISLTCQSPLIFWCKV